MAKNNLTYLQEIHIRNFIDGAAFCEIELSADILIPLLRQLGYRILPNGNRVSISTVVTYTYGDSKPFDKYPDEYTPDGLALTETSNEDNTADETSPSEPSESDAVGDVLQQDV